MNPSRQGDRAKLLGGNCNNNHVGHAEDFGRFRSICSTHTIDRIFDALDLSSGDEHSAANLQNIKEHVFSLFRRKS